MLTPDEQRAATRHLATITSYDLSAGMVSAQAPARAQRHSDAAARIWIAHMAKATQAIQSPSPFKRTSIGRLAQQVLDGSVSHRTPEGGGFTLAQPL